MKERLTCLARQKAQSLTSRVLVTELEAAWSSVLNSCCLLYLGRQCFAFEFFPLALLLDLPLPASPSLARSAFLVCSCLLPPSYPSPNGIQLPLNQAEHISNVQM